MNRMRNPFNHKEEWKGRNKKKEIFILYDKNVKWFNGGAPQFITPLNIFDMKTLGLITEIK